MLNTCFRPARIDDCRWLWRLREHPSVAIQSLNPLPIPYRHHCRWYRKLLGEPSRHLNIFINAETEARLGYIRAEPYQTGHLLSWSINPDLHGQGLGKTMLQQWCKTTPKTLWAQIKPDNTPSQRVANHAGFIKLSATPEMELWMRMECE